MFGRKALLSLPIELKARHFFIPISLCDRLHRPTLSLRVTSMQDPELTFCAYTHKQPPFYRVPTQSRQMHTTLEGSLDELQIEKPRHRYQGWGWVYAHVPAISDERIRLETTSTTECLPTINIILYFLALRTARDTDNFADRHHCATTRTLTGECFVLSQTDLGGVVRCLFSALAVASLSCTMRWICCILLDGPYEVCAYRSYPSPVST